MMNWFVISQWEFYYFVRETSIDIWQWTNISKDSIVSEILRYLQDLYQNYSWSTLSEMYEIRKFFHFKSFLFHFNFFAIYFRKGKKKNWLKVHICALIINMMSKFINLNSSKCSLISVIWLCVQFAVVDYDPGTHDLKTRSLHYFEDDKITKVIEFIIKTSAVVTKILSYQKMLSSQQEWLWFK